MRKGDTVLVGAVVMVASGVVVVGVVIEMVVAVATMAVAFAMGSMGGEGAEEVPGGWGRPTTALDGLSRPELIRARGGGRQWKSRPPWRGGCSASRGGSPLYWCKG